MSGAQAGRYDSRRRRLLFTVEPTPRIDTTPRAGYYCDYVL